MQTTHRFIATSTLSLLGAVLVLAPPRTEAKPPTGFVTAVKPYAVSITPEYVTVPIISAGDRVPLTSDPSKQFQMIGVPDGLGPYEIDDHRIAVYMNHEVAGTALSEPVIGATRWRGAFVSKFILSDRARVLSGEPAYNMIVDPAGNLLPPARDGNSTPAFVRFCSGSLTWKDAGFDRPIYFCGEESNGTATYDGRGGLACAIFDNTLYTLPQLGRFARENTLVRPQRGHEGENDEGDEKCEKDKALGSETVLILMEDGPNADSQLYMYVARKDLSPNASVLARNGLVGGKFYVFVPTNPLMNTEAAFQSGSIAGKWVEITGVESMNETQLEAAADAAGAFGFIKSEDGAWNKRDNNQFFFNATGGLPGNLYGRTYRLDVNKHDVTGPCTLTIIYNADTVIAGGGDIALTPDNISVSKRYVMVCEDGAGATRALMTAKGREGSIWRYDLKHDYAATRIVSLNPPGRDTVPVTAGVWETSGIIDVENLYGRDSWLFVVQAHPPTAAPALNTVEDGQLLLLLPVSDGDDD